MKLKDVVKDLKNTNDDLIIFLGNEKDVNSDVILSSGEPNDGGIKIRNGITYHYLIEVFLAKEFVEDWIQSLDYSPNEDEIAKRLFEYAINDA